MLLVLLSTSEEGWGISDDKEEEDEGGSCPTKWEW
jgi:hypothetical protein